MNEFLSVVNRILLSENYISDVEMKKYSHWLTAGWRDSSLDPERPLVPVSADALPWPAAPLSSRTARTLRTGAKPGFHALWIVKMPKISGVELNFPITIDKGKGLLYPQNWIICVLRK